MLNRESFEALQRWLEELENYVPAEVVKIVVGNNLDKVKSSPLIYHHLSRRPLTRDTHARHPILGILSTSAHIRRHSVRSADGMTFIEASAKTAVGVTEAFNEVVTRIIDTPWLWHEEKSKSSGRTAATATNTTAISGPRRDMAESMPGNIDLSQVQDEDTPGGYLC